MSDKETVQKTVQDLEKELLNKLSVSLENNDHAMVDAVSSALSRLLFAHK